LLASLVLAGAAWAYEVNGVTWAWQDHPFEDPVVVDVDSWPKTYTDSEVSDAIGAALGTWNDVGLDLDFPFGGTAPALTVVGEGNWSVVYREVSGSGWGGTLAYASTWAWKDWIGIDCDVTFLSENDYGAIDWSTDPSGPSGSEYDVEAVALHEEGHCLGLDHSGTDEAVMYYAYQGFRELQDDDVDGVTSLYAATPCVDADGDGFTDCADDCDDGDAAIYPGAPETCDGIDQGCDGVIDADAPRTIAMGAVSASSTSDYIGIGNGFAADADTLLLRAREHFQVDAGTRLVWSLRVLDGAEWTLVRSERSVAAGTDDGGGTDDSGTTDDSAAADDSGASSDDSGTTSDDSGGGDDGPVGDDTGVGSGLDDGSSADVEKSGCACGASSSSPSAVFALMALAFVRRRAASR
jgi:hypothetical protein